MKTAKEYFKKKCSIKVFDDLYTLHYSELFQWMEDYAEIPEITDAEIKKIINDEPELPGNLPEEIYIVAQDRDSLTELLRITVRETKKGILNRYRSRLREMKEGVKK